MLCSSSCSPLLGKPTSDFMSVFLSAEALKTILEMFNVSGAIVNGDWPCRLFYCTILFPSRIAHIMIKEELLHFFNTLETKERHKFKITLSSVVTVVTAVNGCTCFIPLTILNKQKNITQYVF